MVINDDENIGILNSTFVCSIKNNDAQLALYNRTELDWTDCSEDFPERAAQIQTYQSMLLDHQTSISGER